MPTSPEHVALPVGERLTIIADREKLYQALGFLTTDENRGDVADTLPFLARALGLPEPEWDDDRERMVWPWEDSEEDE